MSSRLAILLIWSSSYLLNGRWLTLTSPFLFLSFCFADKGEEIGGYNCLMYAAHYINNQVEPYFHSAPSNLLVYVYIIFNQISRTCYRIQWWCDISYFNKYKNPSSNKLFLFIKSNFEPNTTLVLCLDILGPCLHL